MSKETKAVDQRSSYIAKMKRHMKTLKEAAKKTHGGGYLGDREFMDLLEVPEEEGSKLIIGAKLTRFQHGTDKNGDIFFRPSYVVTEGEHAGTPFSEIISLPDKDSERFQRGVNSLFRILQRLNVDTMNWDDDELIENIYASADELTESKPSIKMSISRYINPNKEDDHRMNLTILGATETPKGKMSFAGKTKSTKASKDDEVEEEVEEETESVEYDFAQLGADADEGDSDSIETLETLAAEHELDPNDYPDSWADLAAALADLEGGEEAEEDAEEEAEEEPAPKKVSGKPKPKGTKGKADLGDDKPVTVKVVSYNAKSNEYVVADNNGDEYEISADDIQW
jgi:hypothetical protein